MRRCVGLLCIYQCVLLFFFAHKCVGLAFNASESLENERPRVEVSKPSFKFTWSNLHVNHNGKVIIDIPAGDCKSGRLLGILGPSGSGKSTFLKSIANKLAGNLILKGNIYINDTNGDISAPRKADIAFVHQEDGFFNMLTVEETLRLALALRHLSEQDSPHESSLLNNKQLLDEVSTIMGLRKVLQRRVGSSGSGSSGGISGGEKKRLSVACELLGNPKLLIADEPTSGLDSFQALQVVTALRSLAQRQGIAAIATLHQPRSSIWLQCDDIMLFTPNGRIAYHGPREYVLSYLDSIGHSCPINVNPAEYLIDLVSVDPAATEENQQHARSRIIDLEERFLSYHHHHHHITDNSSQSAALQSSLFNSVGRDGSDNSDDDHSHHHRFLSHHRSSSPSSHGLLRGAKGLLSRLKRSIHRTALLFRRSLLQTLRDGKVNFIRVTVSSLLATIVGSLYGCQDNGHDKNGKGIIKQGSVSKRVNIAAQAVINVSMLSAVKTLQLFKTERSVVSRERGQSQYGAIEYLIAKSLAELPVDAMIAAVFGLILHHRTGISSPRFSFVGLLSLLAAVAASLGLAVGALLPWGDSALTVGPALMVIHVILGAIGPAGVRLDDDGSDNSGIGWKSVLRPLLKLSPIRLACNALCCLEFAGREVVADNIYDEDYNSYNNSNKRRKSLLYRPLTMAKKILTESSQVIKTIANNKNNKTSMNMKGGDHVLEALGIDQEQSSYHRSSMGLWRLLAGHLAVALLGLLFVKGDDDG